MSEFHRVRRLPPYVFEQVNKLKAKARAAGADIIDLGMGNPDLATPKHVVDKLVETVGKPRTNRYSASRGIPGLRRAQAGYYARRFGVKLNPETQVVATLGSKEGFANMAQAITAPGDVVLVPNPSYPIHAFGFLMAGGAVRSIPSEPTPNFFHTLERAIIHSIPKPQVLVVCYPANPTAYVATLEKAGVTIEKRRAVIEDTHTIRLANSVKKIRAGRADAGLFRRARAGADPLDAETDRRGGLLSVQPDGDGGVARFL